jgi:alkylation response protein AidB-like acyl-CoA dehydrogenase
MSTRVQFGRPLSAKQAVRHLLARMRLLQEASSAGIQRVLSADEYGNVRATQPVLANALVNAAFVLEKSIHLHGGMGFTWEVPLHYALREVRKFDAAFGSGSLAQQVGRDFIQSV